MFQNSDSCLSLKIIDREVNVWSLELFSVNHNPYDTGISTFPRTGSLDHLCLCSFLERLEYVRSCYILIHICIEFKDVLTGQSFEMALCSLRYWEGAELCFFFFLKKFMLEQNTETNIANIPPSIFNM